MNPFDIISEFYKPGSKAYEILVRHSEDVARKAVAVAGRIRRPGLDLDFIREAAMLHDIGMFETNAPGLGCTGRHAYICHGYLGRELLERLDLPGHALVCDRHVGVGITADDVRKNSWPLPVRDMVPVSIEEQIICYADKFFSKTGLRTGIEKSVEEAIRSVAPYGAEKVGIFRDWVRLFDV